MDSFIFNSFKERLMTGNVNNTDTWYFYPVNKAFSEDFKDNIKYIRNTYDFRLFLPEDKEDKDSFFDYYKTNMYSNTYSYQKMTDTDLKSKPFFVTADGFEFFLEQFPGQEHLKDLFFTPGINFYRQDHTEEIIDADGIPTLKEIPRGFYYVNTAEELAWCADKVNSTGGDNTINIVLGDNIGVNKEDITIEDLEENPVYFKNITFTIGSNPAQPFEGIFYGNGFKFVNLILNCDYNANGIFGYIGNNAIISTVTFDGINVLKCSKEISIMHLINDGGNIYAGLLCGSNNGRIENCYIHGDVVVNNFVPKMYSVTKKNDNSDNNDASLYDYYPNYYCYDNPGNIIPYIGYFNEGVFATYSGYGPDDTKHYYWNTENDIDIVHLSDPTKSVLPLEWYYFIAPSVNGAYFMHFTHEKNRINVLWYDGNIISKYSENYGLDGGQVNSYGLYPVNPDDMNPQPIRPVSTQWMGNMKYAPYFNKSIKLTEQNRAAYYVSSLVGFNNSILNGIRVDCTLHTSGTFVGFMGGVAGMQGQGSLQNVITTVTSKDIEETKSGLTYYKRDWINEAYVFPKRSIKNISSLFGSCIINGKLGQPTLIMDSVRSYFNNDNKIVFNVTDKGTPEYDDYYFNNRFGSFAAMVELNTSNISDMWTTKEELNSPQCRCIYVSNSVFGYKETTDSVYSTDGTKYLCSPYNIANYGVTGYEKNMYGIASPLFPEIKPIYNATPSIISTCFDNKGYQISENSKFYRVGLFGIDQQIASPYSNPNFWCINLELDLPGIGGIHTQSQYDWFNNLANNSKSIPTSVIDRLNNQSGENFDIDITRLASKLIYWNNCSINNNYQQAENVFSTVKVPAAAQIPPAYFVRTHEFNYDIGAATPEALLIECNSNNTMPGYIVDKDSKNVYNYAANKILSLYSYFGSDIELITNSDSKYEKTDLSTGFGKIRITLSNPSWYFDANSKYKKFRSTGDRSHTLINNVKNVVIEFSEEALNYTPFTTVFPGDPTDSAEMIKKISSLITVSVDLDGGVGSGLHKCSFVNLNDYFSSNQGWTNYAAIYDGHYINYGFVCETESTPNESNPRHLRVVIPYDISVQYNVNNGIISNPPYSTFECFYVTTHGGPEDLNPADGYRFYLKMESVELMPDTNYFHGYEDVEQTKKIYTSEHGPYVTELLTAAWYGYDGSSGQNRFRFLNSAYQFTDVYEEAQTGYFPKYETSGANGVAYDEFLFMDRNRQITASNGTIYKCYGPYYGENIQVAAGLQPVPYNPKSTITTYLSSASYFLMSAVELKNVPSAYYNWESHFDLVATAYPSQNRLYSYNKEMSDYKSSEEIPDVLYGCCYNYTLRTTFTGSTPLVLVGTQREYTFPILWHKLNIKGYFYNNLYDSFHVNDPQLTAAPENYIGYDTSNFYDVLLLRNSNIQKNIDDAKQYSDDTALLDYYKYTYIKSEPKKCADMFSYGIEVPVEYNYKNNKAGFWYKVPNTSGYLEFNDDLNYYSNVFAIGKTLNQKSILNYCFKAVDNYTWIVSGFSADDFEGIYVSDKSGNSIMYIDVGLGECNDGTSWTLSSYPSEPELSDSVSGLLLEVE